MKSTCRESRAFSAEKRVATDSKLFEKFSGATLDPCIQNSSLRWSAKKTRKNLRLTALIAGWENAVLSSKRTFNLLRVLVIMNNLLEADLPIKSHKQDLLGRKDFARELAKSIVKATGEGSFVIGIHGKWGSGKTSFLNMVDEFLSEDPSKPIILRFSPWLISEQNQLIGAFLTEMGIALGIKDYGKQAKNVGRQLLAYSKFFTPLKFIPGTEPWLSLVEKVVSSVGGSSKDWGNLRELNIDEVRSKVEKELKNLGRPVVIFMDDIDRLSKFEIRQIFQLVKTVANFPNTSFCLAFDPQHIITALHEDSTGDSQEYLEKIIQAGFDLPQASETEINGMLFKGLNFFFESDNQKPLFDESHW